MHRPIEPADADMFADLVRRAFSGLGARSPALRRAHHGRGCAGASGAGRGRAHHRPGRSPGCLWDEREGGLYVSRVAVDPAHRRPRSSRSRSAAGARRGRGDCGGGCRAFGSLPGSPWLANRRLFGRLGFVETALHAHQGYAEPTFRGHGEATPARTDARFARLASTSLTPICGSKVVGAQEHPTLRNQFRRPIVHEADQLEPPPPCWRKPVGGRRPDRA